MPLPIVPPPLQNHGNSIISLNALVRWLPEQVEAEGVDVFTGFAGQDVLFDGDRVRRRRTGDRGIGKHGAEEDRVRARRRHPARRSRSSATGCAATSRRNSFAGWAWRGPAAGAVCHRPQGAVGGPAGRIEAGTVIHTLGYPLRQEEFGGGFIYAMPDAASRWASSSASTTPIRCSIRTWPSTASSSIPSSRAAGGRRAGSLRRKGAAGRRMEHHSEAVHGWRTDCR